MFHEEVNPGHPVVRPMLWLLSLLYRTGISLRHQAYNWHLIPSKKVPAVVVSIGNIACGGTGKTPLVHFLAEELSQNYSVAILSRGYRSSAEKRKEPTRVDASMDAQEVGDEPLWLAQKLPKVQVWVCANRYRSAQKAIENGAEIIILDDGFQHRSLQRDFDVVVLPGESPFGSGYFLPRGYLRDLPSRLKEASLLAVMGPSIFNFNIPQVVFERTSPMDLSGERAALFCAIGNPERFVKQVEQAGAKIAGTFFKQDHGSFSLEEIETLAKQSKADLLVCTEKDYVKLPSKDLSIPLVALPLELKIQDGEDIWKQFIQKIQLQVDHVRRISSHAS